MSFQIEIDKAIKEKRIYLLGDSLPTDWYAAFKLWLPRAEAGDAKAQYNVGRCYNRGDGVEQDSNQAKHWYLKAADQNDPRALFNLYLFYSDERSVEKNSEKAEYYLKRASELKEQRSINIIKNREDEKEKLRVEKIRKDFILAGEEIKEFIQLALNTNQISKAKQLTEEAISKGYEWASLLKPAFEIEYFAFRVKKNVSKSYAGNLDTTYGLTFKVKNNSDKEVSCNIDAYYINEDGSKVRHGGSWLTLVPKETKYSGISCGKNGGFLDKFFTINLHPNISRHNAIYKIFEIQIPIAKKINVSAPVVNDGIIGCFVLTACYGNENHPLVKDFRNFRDQVLLVTPMGKALVGAYYKHGPAAADYVRNKPNLQMILRGLFFAIRFFLPKQK
jgi:Sel1 repeat